MPRAVAMMVSLSVLALALAACGDSTPLPADASTANYTPSTGTFAAVPASASGNVTVVETCNLDAVNGKPAGSEAVPHGSVATFSGWAADSRSNDVPAGVQLVLRGAQDYAVNAATGMPRPDVANANGHPGWATAGYSVQADLSGVAPGTYVPVLWFNVGGKQMQCTTPHKLIIK